MKLLSEKPRVLTIAPRTFALAAVTVASCWLIVQLLPALLVLVVGLFLVGTLSPLVAFLEKHHFRRGWAIGAVFGAVFAAVAALAAITVPAVIEQVQSLVQHEPQLRQKVVEFLARYPATQHLGQTIQGVHYAELAEKAASNVLEFSTHAVAVIAYFVTAVFLALYIMIDRDRLRGGLFAITPRAEHMRLARILLKLEKIVGGYIRGQVVTSALMAVITFVLLVSCRVPGALALAILAGITDVLPFIGGILSVGPAALAALTVNPLTAVVVTAVLVAYQEFESRFVVPRVYGQTLRLPSAVVVLAVLAGGVLMGIVGALLALPVAAAIIMLVDELRIELPGEWSDPEAPLSDQRADARYEKMVEGMPAERAAPIAFELSAARERANPSVEGGELTRRP
jgi:predicted PurR-regulated permease PerM